MTNNKNTIIGSNIATMSTSELKELIKQDCMADTNDQLDVDTIMYIMEVIEEREKNDNTEPLDVDPISAHEDFLANRLSPAQPSPTPVHIQKSKKHPLRLRLLVAALVAVMACSMTASAFEWNFLQVFASWTESTFQFVTQMVTGASADDSDELHELRTEMNKYTSLPLVPHWIPDGFDVTDTQAHILTDRQLFWSTLSNGSDEIAITVTHHSEGINEYIRSSEKTDPAAKEYVVSGITHYILTNTETTTVTWIQDDFVCELSSHLSADILERMIESIYEG